MNRPESLPPRIAQPDPYLSLLEEIGRALSKPSADPDTLVAVLKCIGGFAHCEYGASWNEDEQTQHISCTRVWHEPWLDGSEFVAMARNESFEPGAVGLIRSTLKQRRPFFVADISQASGLRRGPAALACGFRSAFALPLLSGGQTLGALEFFSRSDRAPDASFEKAALVAGTMVGEFLARRQADERYRELVELSPDAIVVHCEGIYVFANQAAVALLGARDMAQIVGQPANSIVHADSRQTAYVRTRYLYEGRGDVPQVELKFQRFDGRSFEAEVLSRYFVYAGRPAIQSIFRDISRRRRDEQRITRLTNLYAALSETSKAITHLSTPQELFSEVCRIAVEHGKFELAGVMDTTPSGGKVGCFVASHGRNARNLLEIRIALDQQGPHLNGPVASSILSGAHRISNDFLNDPGTVHWRGLASEANFRSGGAFPLRRGGKVLGALAVYSSEAGIFDKDLTDLLSEMALNLSFGLDAIERETRRREAEAALRENERALSTLLANLPGMAYRCRLDDSFTLEFASEGCVQLTGYRPIDLVDNRAVAFADLIYPGDRARVQREIHEFLASGDHFTLEYQIVCADAAVKWVSEKAQAVRNEAGEIVALEGIIDDITDRKRFEERLSFLAQYDVLTGLPNRALFYDRLRQAVVRARREQSMVGLMFLDLDRFKQINDTLGHAAGDRVLRVVADRLKGFLREVDTIARLGGDEFTVVIEGVNDAVQLSSVAEKIHNALAEPVMIEGRDMSVSASIGITLYPRDGEDIEQIIKNADIAMYHAKHKGGRQQYQFYDASMGPLAAEHLELETRLRRAIEKQEFILHYQPVVDIASGRVAGMEALVRWQSPQGLVSPANFIPLAEESGLILEIGKWVLQAACTQARKWQREGLPALRLAVNLSPLQLRQDDLIAMVAEILRESGLAPQHLELEITESTVMERSRDAIAILKQLENLGIGLSVDDFGTGYSSLAYLKQFPVHNLKIDRSFVRDITTDRDDAAIVGAMVAMAKNLGLQVIAEGVETRQQLEFLRAAGCNLYQGYYFSVPLPAKAFAELVKRQDRREA
ncbi:MAG TPA: EAL domain-containing protein [Burkholderiales bacterium]|nr:EAL domain-containing protein [Burkholderiales bacterium]